MKKYSIEFTKEEIWYLAHIMDHFTDYMYLDDRPDHGFGILKEYRKARNETKTLLAILAGKLLRKRKKINEAGSSVG